MPEYHEFIEAVHDAPDVPHGAPPRTGTGFFAKKPGWHHVVTGQKPHHADDCVPDCVLNPDRLRDAAAASFSLDGYAAPIEFTTDEHGTRVPQWPTRS